MATLLLSAAGAAVGGLFGPLGAIIGRAAGALAGYALDQSLFGQSRTLDGGRLADLDVQAAREGAAIPRVYGRVRISGQMIWATRFEETVSETSEGGKGGMSGTTVRRYSYFANFAIGLCEGPIARIGRVWADGKPFDLASVMHRIHAGSEAEAPDSLIAAKQGEAPAYRGTAYIVFERLPLEAFGNRVPLFSFEVIRPVGRLEPGIRAVTLIPGATEFGYDPEPVRRLINPGHSETLNRHVDGARTDWAAALDDLTALCPNLEEVALVVAWYGDDLRAGHCTLMPAVTERDIATSPGEWRVAGLDRGTARLVSRYDDKPAYGGTPSDASMVRAIRDLHERGLKVGLYPFIMMDIPAGNALPDPYGGAEQAAHPWRGSITASLAPGEPGTPDKTAAAASEVAAFVGTAAPEDFDLAGDTVVYSGPDEWTFRRLILHCAKLAEAAGGVETFLVGSELRGLTTLRSGASTYPFVAALTALAEDVRTILGPETKISYGADWSEYFGHQPADGTGDVHFHLDPFWASAAVDFVGIDNYMPLADWREGSDHLDAEAHDSGLSRAYLRSNIAAGEGFDWYYASDGDRAEQLRTPIADGAYGKPWVFRYKDLAGWWGNAHHDRPGGVELPAPTAWVPMGKPIRFTEVGCPAVDKGANQPNVFPDPKSSVSGLPHFSTGARDDLIQRRFLEAVHAHFDPAHPDHVAGSNPVSPVYGAPMVDPAAIHVWTFDARPYPAFPYRRDVWADGANWETGHWLSGRLGAPGAGDLVRAILADYGIADASVDDLDGAIDGYAIGELTSARAALEPLSALLMFEAFESGDRLRFVRRGRRATASFSPGDFAEEGDGPLISVRRAQESELPAEIAIGFADPLADYRAASVHSRRLVGGSRRVEARDTGAALGHAVASGLADAMLQDLWAGREVYRLALSARALALEPADICDVESAGVARTVMVTRIEDGLVRRIEARTIEPAILSAPAASPRIVLPPPAAETSRPEVMILDLPLLSGLEPPFAPRIAAFARPWPGAIAVAIGTAGGGFTARQALDRRATMGELTLPLGPGPSGRWDRGNTVTVRLYGGALAGAPDATVLNGANLAAVGTAETGFEVIQFAGATLIAADTYRLDGLIRGLGGTGDIGAAGHAAGARFVLLDGAVAPLAITEAESGLALTLRCGAAGAVYDPDTFADVPLVAARRGLRCLAPVHLKATRDEGSGDLAIGWIRQTRVGGDAWEPVEVPLGETTEGYRVEILDDDIVVRSFTSAAPPLVYAAADQVADFGALPASVAVRIRQVSPTDGPGSASEELLHA